MAVLAPILTGLATVIAYVLNIYKWVIIISALITWVNPDPWNPIVQFLRRVTEPVLAPIRRWLGVRMMGGAMIDLSPLIAILIIYFLEIAIPGILLNLAAMH
jgi:YggT family protein